MQSGIKYNNQMKRKRVGAYASTLCSFILVFGSEILPLDAIYLISNTTYYSSSSAVVPEIPSLLSPFNFFLFGVFCMYSATSIIRGILLLGAM